MNIENSEFVSSSLLIYDFLTGMDWCCELKKKKTLPEIIFCQDIFHNRKKTRTHLNLFLKTTTANIDFDMRKDNLFLFAFNGFINIFFYQPNHSYQFSTTNYSYFFYLFYTFLLLILSFHKHSLFFTLSFSVCSFHLFLCAYCRRCMFIEAKGQFQVLYLRYHPPFIFMIQDLSLRWNALV